MPRIVRTTYGQAEDLICVAPPELLTAIICNVAASALDDCQDGVDTAAVVYEQLARLGITVP